MDETSTRDIAIATRVELRALVARVQENSTILEMLRDAELARQHAAKERGRLAGIAMGIAKHVPAGAIGGVGMWLLQHSPVR